MSTTTAQANTASETGGERTEAERAREAVNSAASSIKEASGHVRDRLLDVAGDYAGSAATQLKRRGESEVELRKLRLAARIRRVEAAGRRAAADVAPAVPAALAQPLDSAAERAGEIAAYLERRSTSELVSDAVEFTRENPVPVLAGLFAAGLAAGRFLRASEPGGDEQPSAQTGDGLYPPHASDDLPGVRHAGG